MCQFPLRVKIKVQVLVLWSVLCVPSILSTLFLSFSSSTSESLTTEQISPNVNGTIISESFSVKNYTCYENYTLYIKIYEIAKFWIEGILQFVVGSFGLFGNALTIFVLSKNKRTNFNNLLIYLSITDIVLILIFLIMSSCTMVNYSIGKSPLWFNVLFPYVLWPLGNIAINASVLMIVAVSSERYLAICRPLQYKPSPFFYVLCVQIFSFSLNLGKFLEYQLSETTNDYNYSSTLLMNDTRYILFSRWQEILVTGLLPLVALSLLNYGIYSKIRNSAKFRITNISYRKKYKRSNGSSWGSVGERSSKLLIGIVVVFLFCHVVRLAIQIDAIVHPSILAGDHYNYCYIKDQLYSPFAVWILTCFNTFLLVLNSSINFIVYCLVGKEFRRTLCQIFCGKSSLREGPPNLLLSSIPLKHFEDEKSCMISRDEPSLLN